MLGIWPAILVAGVPFAALQFLVSNLHGPWLVDVVASIASMASLVLFLRVWRPRDGWDPGGRIGARSDAGTVMPARADVMRAWVPWIILSVLVFVWGLPYVKAALDAWTVRCRCRGCTTSCCACRPWCRAPSPEPAVFAVSWLSATGTGILIAAVVAGAGHGVLALDLARIYWRTLRLVRTSLLTIATMLALGFTTRYAGLDATLGLAFARTGVLYPFFGTMLGWLGVALTGSDTSSNVLFGSLQRITAEQLGLNPVLMAAANSSGGVMGKMIDAQSIVVARRGDTWYGHEGDILRYVFWHSLALASLVGVLVLLQAYVSPFSRLVGW